MAGFREASASSTPRVNCSVFAPGCFSTISINPSPVSITASPIGGGVPSVTVATSPMRSIAPLRWTSGIAARSAAPCTGRHVRDRHALVRHVDKSAGGHGRRVARGCEHLIERDVVGLQPLGIDVHLNLAVALAPDRHVRHAGDRHQPRAHGPFGERRQLDLRQLAGGEADLHDAAQRRQRRHHNRRVRRRGQRAARRASRAPATICRASRTLVPSSKIITTDERPSTDFDRSVFRPATRAGRSRAEP